MSTEQTYVGIIGENTPVSVVFDYSESEPEYVDCPAWPATVEISAVNLCNYDDKTGKWTDDNIDDCLKESVLDRLEVECHEYMENPERDE